MDYCNAAMPWLHGMFNVLLARSSMFCSKNIGTSNCQRPVCNPVCRRSVCFSCPECMTDTTSGRSAAGCKEDYQVPDLVAMKILLYLAVLGGLKFYPAAVVIGS